jgi:tRNA U34 5-methylaminomethyl-2-thiouridine-forming methyltransferase MnmC
MTRTADVTWRDGVPVAEAFQDPYFSLADGLAETAHVFLGGNRLGDRLRDGFQVAELGFGTGLNFCAVVRLWAGMGAPGVVRFTSFEAFPMAAADMARALAAFPEVAEIAEGLVSAWAKGARVVEIGGVRLEVIEGDARVMVPEWPAAADAWFLDGFAPASNPELWEPDLLRAVAEKTAPGGTAATYSAAGAVRRGLDAGGFAVERVPGFGAKRHMTVARKDD